MAQIRTIITVTHKVGVSCTRVLRKYWYSSPSYCLFLRLSVTTYSFFRRPFFLLAEAKDGDDEAAVVAVVVLSGMGELPVCEPDEILVEEVVEARVLALD